MTVARFHLANWVMAQFLLLLMLSELQTLPDRKLLLSPAVFLKADKETPFLCDLCAASALNPNHSPTPPPAGAPCPCPSSRCSWPLLQPQPCPRFPNVADGPSPFHAPCPHSPTAWLSVQSEEGQFHFPIVIIFWFLFVFFFFFVNRKEFIGWGFLSLNHFKTA